MTSKEFKDIKNGQEFYIVVMSKPHELICPFINTGEYSKPLGVFKTKICENKSKHEWDWTSIDVKLDTSEYNDLILKCRYNEIPEGKTSSDYGIYWSDHITIMVYDDNTNKKDPHESIVENLFINYDDAQKYYDKKLKLFNKNIKSYITRMKYAINEAQKNIIIAKNNLEKYENIL